MFISFKRGGALPKPIHTHRLTLVERVNDNPSLYACIVLVILLVVLPALAELTCALFGAH